MKKKWKGKSGPPGKSGWGGANKARAAERKTRRDQLASSSHAAPTPEAASSTANPPVPEKPSLTAKALPKLEETDADSSKTAAGDAGEIASQSLAVQLPPLAVPPAPREGFPLTRSVGVQCDRRMMRCMPAPSDEFT